MRRQRREYRRQRRARQQQADRERQPARAAARHRHGEVEFVRLVRHLGQRRAQQRRRSVELRVPALGQLHRAEQPVAEPRDVALDQPRQVAVVAPPEQPVPQPPVDGARPDARRHQYQQQPEEGRRIAEPVERENEQIGQPRAEQPAGERRPRLRPPQLLLEGGQLRAQLRRERVRPAPRGKRLGFRVSRLASRVPGLWFRVSHKLSLVS